MPIIYLCTNQLGPTYLAAELGIGEGILKKTIAAATGKSPQQIQLMVDKVGDLGKVAETARTTQATMFAMQKLTLSHVFRALHEIAATTGASSVQKKSDRICSLLASCQGNEARYLIRLLEGKLRIGLAEKTIIVALARAAMISCAPAKQPPSAESLAAGAGILKAVYNELPNYDRIVPALLEHGIERLSEFCKLTPGVPLKPMLAHPTKSISEVLTRLEGKKFTCEYKYDGERAQIHRLVDGSVFIYSRNSENLTPKYPDLIDRLQKISNDSQAAFVLDCEAVAWDRETKAILPFQVLSTRRKKETEAENVKIQACLFAFDILYYNGEVLSSPSCFVYCLV